MQYNFEWNVDKIKTNWEKHGVRFEQSATVFRDPRAMTIYDADHSGQEERWITLGMSSNGSILVVHHTFKEDVKGYATIRVFSSRKATKKEQQQYIRG